MRPTASKVGLLSYCAYWATPEAVWPKRDSDPADRGNRFHTAIAEYTQSGVVVAVDDDIAADYAAACAWVYDLRVSAESDIRVMVEPSFAWDPATDEAKCIGAYRNYSAAGERLCGTADLVLVTRVQGKPVAAMVWDWKTGNSSESGPQLRALSLMVARALGVDHVTCAALDVGPLGVRELYREDLDAFELANIAGTLADLTAQIPGAQPQPGAHCSELFCPAKLTCPLVENAAADLAQVLPADALVRRETYSLTAPITTPEHAAWAVGVISLMKSKLDDLKDQIKALVPEGGWRLSDGRTLEERTSTVKATKFSQETAISLLRELGATDQQIADLEVDAPFERSQGLRVYGGAAKPRAKRSKVAA